MIANCWNRLTAIIIHCNFHQTTHLPLGYLYVCYFIRFEEIDNPKVTAVVGNHIEKKSNLDVKLLHATRVKMDYIPQNLETFFPHLVGFFFHNTGIKSFSKDDLKPFPKMTYLMMQGSEIEELPNNIFEFNGKIDYVNFSKNKIKLIGPRVLSSIPNLKLLNLERNICVSGKGDNPAQLELLKSKIKECYKIPGEPTPTTLACQSVKTSTCPPSVTCPPSITCGPTKEKEYENAKNLNSDLKKEIANLKLKNRQLENKINNEALNCEQPNITVDPKEIKNLRKVIEDLKLKISQQELTVKSFKDELAKKSGELKNEIDNIESCKQKLGSVTEALSEVNAKIKSYGGNPINIVRNFDNMKRDECLEALKASLSDKELFAKENEYLMNKKSEMDSLRLICDVTAWNKDVSCNLKNFKCFAENQKVSEVTNKGQTAVDKTKINELIVLNQHALFLPAGIGQVFPNLVQLTVTNSHLTRLNSNSLNLVNLKVLALAGNQISDIFKTDLDKLERLENLNLSGNRIKKIKVGVFDNLVELKVLALDGNEIEEIDNELFSKNLKLTSIFLRKNQLKFIGSEILTPLSLLNIIDFSENLCVKAIYAETSIKKLNHIFSDKCSKPSRLCCRFLKLSDQDVSCRAVDFTFQNKNTKLSSVKSLDACTAEDSLIDARVISRSDNSELEDVTILEIIDETVTFLPSNLAEHFLQLTKLVVVNSKLMSLSKRDFAGLLFVNFIDVSRNELTLLEPGLFDEVPLKHLDISSNKLVSFPTKFFEKLSELRFLNASRNDFEKLEADLFPRRNALEEIFFEQNNNLYEIDPKFFKNLRQIKIIDFTDNPCIGLRFPDNSMNDLYSKAINC